MVCVSEGLYNRFQILKSMLTILSLFPLAWIIDEESTITISNHVKKSMTSQAYLNREPISSEKIYSKLYGIDRKSRGFKGGDIICPS